MKKVIKSIAAAFAAIIASTAMISSASAATYVDYYGNTYFDGINDGAVYYVDNLYGSYYSYQETYVGYDVFYGDVYFDPSYGYYAHTGSSYFEYLGWNFTLTQFAGIDAYGRNIYYNSSIGYFVLDNYGSYISYGNNLSKVAF